MNGERKPPRRRVTRAEASKILGTSYANVRRLQRKRQLRGKPDRHGHFWFDREEVEALARKRGMQITHSGELAARVFALIKEQRTFQDIVIETAQEPRAIRALWRQFKAGFDDEAPPSSHGERSGSP